VERPPGGFASNGIASPEIIKEALCQHGPLATTILATPIFQAYSGESVFQENLADCPTTGCLSDPGTDYLLFKGPDGLLGYNTNHSITIIGWDDVKGAWLIKNSWGIGWGGTAGRGSEKGYAWVHYGTNNVGFMTASYSAPDDSSFNLCK
jgi:cathepsin L